MMDFQHLFKQSSNFGDRHCLFPSFLDDYGCQHDYGMTMAGPPAISGSWCTFMSSIMPRCRTRGRSQVPSGNQTWLAGKSPIYGGFYRKITDKWSIFHCHVWLPEGSHQGVSHVISIVSWLYKNMLLTSLTVIPVQRHPLGASILLGSYSRIQYSETVCRLG